MHGMSNYIINIIGIPCLGISIVFIKIGSLHQILQWNHIDLHFGFKSLLQCNLNVYLIINIIFTFLQSISMNFKVFLLIYDILIVM